TSDSARSFIRCNDVGRLAIVVGIILIIVAYLLLAIYMVHVMQRLGTRLKALEYLPADYYEFRIMPPRIAIACACFPVIAATVAVAFILFGVKCVVVVVSGAVQALPP